MLVRSGSALVSPVRVGRSGLNRVTITYCVVLLFLLDIYDAD
jgi:hypothetical protein